MEGESRFGSDQEQRNCFALPEILASKLEQPSRDCQPTPEQRHLPNSTKYFTLTNPFSLRSKVSYSIFSLTISRPGDLMNGSVLLIKEVSHLG